MKVENNLQDLKTQGEFEAVGFGIDASALAFKILSGSIYSDPILAIVRELSANALDAHTEADNVGTPFVIDAPNALRQYFRIRDYGIGLAKDDVTTLYTRYFRSTKTKSNDLIGCMGLGSKTPFAYVDNFSVTSYYNGEKHAFTAFKNEQGTPSVALLSSTKTDEPNGLEIEFPVKRTDISYFQEKIRTTLQFFTKRPTVTGIPNFEFKEFTYFFKNESFGILEERADSWVVMGNIGYPLEDSRFTGDHALGDDESSLVDWGVHLFVPIGAVEIAASREELSYTPKTLQVIKKIIIEANKQVEAESQKKINEKVHSIWDARIMASQIHDNVIGSILGRKIRWNDQEIEFEVEAPKDTKACYTDNGHGMSRKRTTTIQCREDKLYFINDRDSGGYACIRHYMDNNDLGGRVYVFDNDEITQEYIDEVGFGHLLVRTSSLDLPPKVKRPYVKKEKTGPRPSRIQYIGQYGELLNTDVNFADGGVYLIKKGRDILYPPHWNGDYKTKPVWGKLHSPKKHINLMKNLGLETKVYVVRQSTFDSKKFQKTKDKWVPLVDHIYEQFKNLPLETIQLATDRATFQEVKNNHSLSWMGSACDKKWTKLEKDSEFVKAMELYKELDKVQINIGPFTELNEFCGKVHKIETNKKLIEDFLALNKRYPLLQLLYDYPKNLGPISQYIQLIDLDEEFQLDQKRA